MDSHFELVVSSEEAATATPGYSFVLHAQNFLTALFFYLSVNLLFHIL
jgi:hypothetical protein